MPRARWTRSRTARPTGQNFETHQVFECPRWTQRRPCGAIHFVTLQTPARHSPPSPEARDPGLLVDVVVLSPDVVLYEAIRAAIGERNPVWRARSAEETVDLLLTGRCGVLLLDMAAVTTRPATLVQQIADQFPDVVAVVAGRREDETLLAQLISDGLVYRFMHKPLTAKRAGMFLQAAIRCHVERRAARKAQPLLPLATVLPMRATHRKWAFVAAGVALFAGLLGLLAGHGRGPAAGDSASVVPAAVTPTDAQRRSSSDEVLARARAALAAGRYESPPGRNALDLYAAVLLAQPSQAEARAGLERTVAWIAGEARSAFADGHRAEAERLLKRLEAAAPDDDATARLASLLVPPPTAAGPLLAVSPGSVEPSMSAANLTGTPNGTDARPLVEARTARPAVYSDPLAPRVSNSVELRAQAMLEARRRAGRLYPGAPVASLPTAGYVRNYRAPVAASARTSPQVAAGAVATVALPADAMERVFAADPVYPAAALQNRIEGWVELMFTITESGAVSDVEVVDAQPRGIFESAATQAVGNWRYRPRFTNGQPVQRRSVVTLRFNLDG